MSSQSRDNTTLGKVVHNTFAEVLNLNQNVAVAIANSVGLTEASSFQAKVVARAKTQVVMEIDGSEVEIGFNIKSFGKSGFNQIERCKLETFCEKNRIRKRDMEFLRRLILRKGKDPRNTPLVQTSREKNKIEDLFGRLSIGMNALLGEDRPQMLVLCDTVSELFKVYNFAKQVEPHLCQQAISFSPKGGNLLLGKYIAFQRKGGDGIGGRPNDVQIKMNTKLFFDEAAALLSIPYANY